MEQQKTDIGANFLDDYLTISSPIIESTTSNFSQVLTNYLSIKSEAANEKKKSYDKIFSYYDTLKRTYLTNLFSLNYCTFDDFISKLSVLKEENRNDSHLFNVFQFFGIGETLHSSLLSRLLTPGLEHGQDKLLLKIFLRNIVEVTDEDHWTVTVEKGRVDVLLKRIHPTPSVVIIENKSNNAGDQDNQLYRYWYQEIYKPNCHDPEVIQKTSNNLKFRIIYLVPNDWKAPSENSLLRPDGYDKSLPEKIPITPLRWTFQKEIFEWLNVSLNEIPKHNYRLREYIKQYRDFIYLMK